MIIFTAICANYLPKAISLAKSVKQNLRDARFVLCLVEREIQPEAKSTQEFDEIVLAKDIGYPNFDRFIFQHSLVEASTAVKAQVFKHLLESYADEDHFVYLDPDIIAYSDFVELRSDLEKHSIILCPHLLEPGNVEMEISSLQHGTYNLGFLALSRGDETSRFLDWWAERLLVYCYDDIPHGIFTDQRWIDLAPSFFDVHILKHRGYDLATWSLLNSDVKSMDGQYYVSGEPLRFAHFSGYDSGTVDWAISQWLKDQPASAFRDLYRDYKTVLDENGQASLGSLPWSYNYYRSGQGISRRIRRLIRQNSEVQDSVENPFDYSNEFFYRKLLFSRIRRAMPGFLRNAGSKSGRLTGAG
jgi:hypothetical protein